MNHDLNLPSYEDFLQLGLGALPADADKSENSFYYPIISSACMIASEQMIHAQFVYEKMFAENLSGEELDAFISDRTSLKRRQATRTKGGVTFYGNDGTYIQQGTVVSAGAEGKRFATLFGDTIVDGEITVAVEAVDIGYLGYFAESSIDTLVTPTVGVSAVTNKQYLQSGIDDESDADFYARYKWELHNFPYNLNSDTLVAWAAEVEGVGQVRINGTKGSTLITIYALDSSYEPANEELKAKLQAMYNDRLFYGFSTFVASPTKEFVPINIKVKQEDAALAKSVKDTLTRYIKTYVDPRWVRTDLSVWEVINEIERITDMSNVLDISIGDGSSVYHLSATDGSKLLAIGDVTVTKG